MPVCASCGHEAAEAFRFCPECGAPAAAAAHAREQRKTVTVLFCDVAGYTATGERLDPEALRQLQSRYFDDARAALERHGGTVEKFIGDAVMAVFGIPHVHEDDALRACRAALELRDAVAAVGLEARIGVHTGEVVTGSGDALVTGDAVNVAARLEQAAHPGHILLGADTLTLVRDAVETEPVEPLELKGKAGRVPAFRLVEVRAVPKRRHDAPFVGRKRELALMRDAWERAQAEERCALVTIVGDAGLGKSRLTSEFLSTVEAHVVTGRCLPYGDGITYWPVVEVVKGLNATPSDPLAAAAIRSLLGETGTATRAEEIAWAFRKLLEEQAKEQPLMVVLDDIHWGEETFLDLVEQVALLTSDAPILLLCMARPELLDRRPAWPVTLRLDPLGDSDVEELIPRRIGGEQRERITRAAGGNPLFIAEMVAMSEEADGDVAVPQTLHALLAARLDLLEPAERRVLECAAIEGEVFHRGAVRALAPEEEQVTARLASLVRRELVRPDRAQVSGDEGFRFRHLLIRDAVHDAIPKANRAELHVRFASWVEDRGADLVEVDEIVGLHLEQAVRYGQELGRPDPELAARAGARLSAAGRQALWRGDRRAAASLLERSLELTRPIALDVGLELDLASAVGNDPRRAAAMADSVVERALQAGDETGGAVARVVAAAYRMEFAAEPAVDELEGLGRGALALLEGTGDDAGLARVWRALGEEVAHHRGREEDWAQAAERAIHHGRLAGQVQTDLYGLPQALVQGARPADEALETLDRYLPGAPHPESLLNRAWILAMLERFEEAWSLAHEASERVRELTGSERGKWYLAEIATLGGDHETAVRWLRRWYEFLEAHGRRSNLSTFAPRLGRSLCALGRYDEAESLARLGRGLAGKQDAASQLLWRLVAARVHAWRGEHSEAERLAHRAVAIAAETDWLSDQGTALCDLAEVLAVAGRTDEAAEALEQALERYGRKKNLAMVAQVRPRLEELRERTQRVHRGANP